MRRYDGSNPFLPILLAVRGVIYDVSAGREFYGRGGGYNVFAGTPELHFIHPRQDFI